MASRKYVRKDGTVVISTPCTNEALRKRGILRAVHVITQGMHRNVGEALRKVFQAEIEELFGPKKRKP